MGLIPLGEGSMKDHKEDCDRIACECPTIEERIEEWKAELQSDPPWGMYSLIEILIGVSSVSES